MNTPIFEENPVDKFKGIDIMRAVRSFDPCLPCGVHMYLGKGKVLKKVHTPTDAQPRRPGLTAGGTVADPEEDTDLRAAGDRIEALFEQLQATAEPRVLDVAEELLRLVTELYGAGLARVVELVRDEAPELLRRLVDDELLGSLLVVHGLHPNDLVTRVESALESVRPFLQGHGGDVLLLELDEERGAVHLRLLGSCDGCPSSAVTLRTAVERAIAEAAPEILLIDVERAVAAASPRPWSSGRRPLAVPSTVTETGPGDGAAADPLQVLSRIRATQRPATARARASAASCASSPSPTSTITWSTSSSAACSAPAAAATCSSLPGRGRRALSRRSRPIPLLPELPPLARRSGTGCRSR